MASSPLQAFDPLAKHYFTSHGTPAPPPARTTYAHAPPQPSSVPSRPPMQAPQPVPAGAGVKPIFTSFQKDRASPDLPDVKKKPAQAWGASSPSSRKA